MQSYLHQQKVQQADRPRAWKGYPKTRTCGPRLQPGWLWHTLESAWRLAGASCGLERQPGGHLFHRRVAHQVAAKVIQVNSAKAITVRKVAHDGFLRTWSGERPESIQIWANEEWQHAGADRVYQLCVDRVAKLLQPPCREVQRQSQKGPTGSLPLVSLVFPWKPHPASMQRLIWKQVKARWEQLVALRHR